MLIRLDRLLGLATAWFALSAGVASSASNREVPPQLWEAAECMADILRAEPRVTNNQVKMSEGSGAPYPILEYSSVDELGRRRFTEVRLFEISGIGDARFVFDRADIAGDPVAFRALSAWKARCQAGVGYITSVPGGT